MHGTAFDVGFSLQVIISMRLHIYNSWTPAEACPGDRHPLLVRLAEKTRDSFPVHATVVVRLHETAMSLRS